MSIIDIKPKIELPEYQLLLVTITQLCICFLRLYVLFMLSIHVFFMNNYFKPVGELMHRKSVL